MTTKTAIAVAEQAYSDSLSRHLDAMTDLEETDTSNFTKCLFDSYLERINFYLHLSTKPDQCYWTASVDAKLTPALIEELNAYFLAEKTVHSAFSEQKDLYQLVILKEEDKSLRKIFRAEKEGIIRSFIRTGFGYVLYCMEQGEKPEIELPF